MFPPDARMTEEMLAIANGNYGALRVLVLVYECDHAIEVYQLLLKFQNHGSLIWCLYKDKHME